MRRHRKLLSTLAVAALTLPAAATALPSANPANKLIKRGLDPVQYDRATKCTKAPAKGVLALQAWLQRNSAGSSWGIMRCERWGKKSASLHAEGRAIDWHLDAGVPSQRRAADRLIKLLLAEDRAGNPVALARRMGIQGIIFNCRSWFGSQDGRMGKYSACYGKNGKPKRVDRTTAHRDHIHIELNKLGAAKKTTFWNARVTWPTELDEQSERPWERRPEAPAPAPVAAPVADDEPQLPPQAQVPDYDDNGAADDDDWSDHDRDHDGGWDW